MQKYRSIRDTDWFDVESDKTILVGPNEAGKSAILQALQQLNPPEDAPRFNALRDYPRSEYNDITVGKVDPDDVTVASARFVLEAEDLAELPPGYETARYEFNRRLNNTAWHTIVGGPGSPTYDSKIGKEFSRLAAHADKQVEAGEVPPSKRLADITHAWNQGTAISLSRAKQLLEWLDSITTLIDEENLTEDNRHTKLAELVRIPTERDKALEILEKKLPVFVLFNNYFRVKPSVHLEHLAERLRTGVLDDDQYDYGNQCLLKLLGFTAKELSDLGRADDPNMNNVAAIQSYKDQLDQRQYQLNAASVRLTGEIRSVWNPDVKRAEADRLRVEADGQYLKVVVEDDLGVEIELDQRSEGFQWLVSFFVVFFAEAADRHENAILLLDEPGLSLHGLKQREFRSTISRLAAKNQTLYTTHSPFLVGPDELDRVRVVEMTDREQGTVVHTSVTAQDPAALLPLQEALGYDLAQSLFAQRRNLVLEGLTDYWYLDGTSQLLASDGGSQVNDSIALLSAESAGKVVYFATILHSNKLKVAALLDSDSAGDNAAKQDTLVHQLGNKNILRTKDAYQGPVKKPEIEDLLRETLITVAKVELGWNIHKEAAQQPSRPIVDVFSSIKGFSKYKLAKAYLRWTRLHTAADLTSDERAQWTLLIDKINKALK